MNYEEHQAMWPKMIATLAAIDAELGMPEDGCNSPAQTLAKIRSLRLALRGLLDTFHKGHAVVGQPEARAYVLAAVRAGERALVSDGDRNG